MQSIGIGMFALRPQRRFGMPKAGDVVVNFLLAGNFNQLNRALAPISDRLHPKTWTAFEIRFQILIGREILLTLHQAEAARVKVGKAADLKILGIAERAPQFLTAAVEHAKPVGIVDRGAEIVDVVT